MAVAFDPEFKLLAACAGWPRSDARSAAVRAAAGAGVDWEFFARVVARHRMAGMAADGLAAAGVAMPGEPGRQLRDAARADMIQALATGKEAIRLVALLDGAGIRAVVLKGPPLAMLAYRTLAVRQVRDLDLLVDPADLPRALELVRGEGYALYYDHGDKELRPDRSAVLKDVLLVHSTRRLLVELHARVNENAELLPLLTAKAASVAIAPGLEVPALTGEPLLVYLMVHGFRHGWSRLKWLADVAALVGAMDEAAVAGLVRDMHARGLGLVAASTLLVLQKVMGTSLPASVTHEAGRGRRARMCAALAVRRLTDGREPDRQSALTSATEASLLLLSPSPRYRRRELARLLVDNPFAVRFGGGRGIVALSILLRPLLYGGRRLCALASAAFRRV